MALEEAATVKHKTLSETMVTNLLLMRHRVGIATQQRVELSIREECRKRRHQSPKQENMASAPILVIQTE
jgi:hypothetical protein